MSQEEDVVSSFGISNGGCQTWKPWKVLSETGSYGTHFQDPVSCFENKRLGQRLDVSPEAVAIIQVRDDSGRGGKWLNRGHDL
jgi:hypothetical protein